MADQIIKPVENGFATLGLTSAVSRMVAGIGVGLLIVVGLTPSISFDEQGNARPWKLLASDKQAGEATWWPWYMWPLSLAVLFGVLI